MASEEQWSEEELKAAVTAYAEMYRSDYAGRKVNKAKIYRDLEELFGRRGKAFERRMMNISHVVETLGGQAVRGLLPAANIGANRQAIIERLVKEAGFLGNNIIQAITLSPLTLEKVDDSAEKLRKDWSQSGMKVLPPIGFLTAESYTIETTQRKRSAEVKAWVLLEANGICECCKSSAPFLKAGGIPYLEVHHVVHLAEDGPDTTENAVAICPNCHRALHLAANKNDLVKSLYIKVVRLVRPLFHN
jgi:5-methylcytosine-specific restriction protein A